MMPGHGGRGTPLEVSVMQTVVRSASARSRISGSWWLRASLFAALLASSLLFAKPAEAQMAQPLGIDDINWRATLGTGVALETGGLSRRDPFLLYFGAEVSKSWRWWYGLTFLTRGSF